MILGLHSKKNGSPDRRATNFYSNLSRLLINNSLKGLVLDTEVEFNFLFGYVSRVVDLWNQWLRAKK